jgi:YegS/Rv2252/BmrU family lipid kinase
MRGMAYATVIHCPGGGSASDEGLEQARKLLSAKLDLDVFVVDADNSAAELAQEAVARGSKVVIASGGDGTVSSVASALIGKPDTSLGILPRGTANSISVQLGIPHDLEAACAIITGGHTRVIDSAVVQAGSASASEHSNTVGGAHGQTMLLMATIGVHAEAITKVDPERKKRYGALAYVLEEVERLLDNELFEVTLEANGQRETCLANAVTVANIARPATVLAQGPASIEEDDGLLDVTIVAIRGFAEALATTFHLATSALRQLPAERDNVGHFRAREVRITTKDPKRVMIDGDDATSTPITVRCLPRSLSVLVPPPK